MEHKPFLQGWYLFNKMKDMEHLYHYVAGNLVMTVSCIILNGKKLFNGYNQDLLRRTTIGPVDAEELWNKHYETAIRLPSDFKF